MLVAGSGGGHVRQLLDLADFWQDHDYRFVTEPTAMGTSIAKTHPTRFVAHFAAGQLKLRRYGAFMRGLFGNIGASWRIVADHAPQLVLTTGAGSMMFVVLFARLRGAQIVVVDSFARFAKPSLFARLAGPFAHHRISQSEASAQAWSGSRRKALAFDPMTVTPQPRPAKEAMLFATVGATLPFDRLAGYVRAAKAEGAIGHDVLLQTGEGAAKGASLSGEAVPGLREVETLPFDAVQATLAKADIVVCHGGTGSIITALQNQCRVIAVPRLHRLGEHYDDHQLEITTAFAARGLIRVVDSEAEFRNALATIGELEPQVVRTDYTALVAHLRTLVPTLRERA